MLANFLQKEGIEVSRNMLKIGIVGLKIGNAHIKDYLESKSAAELILCDLDAKLLNEIGDMHNIKKRYTDFTEMLTKEKLDAVSICAPNKLHMPLSIQALEAGCHVLCEKPMARNAEEAEKMLLASRKCGKKLMINFNQRFSPVNQAMKSMICNGVLGEIYFARTLWHRRRGVPWWYPLTQAKEMCGGGPIIDLGVHILDCCMWWCDFPEPEWVLGNTYCKIADKEAEKHGLSSFELEDMGVAMIRMKNGMCLELEASWASNREGEKIATRLYGTKGGTVICTYPDAKSEIYMEMGGKLVNVNLAEGEFGNFPLAPKKTIRQAFLDAIINDTETPCSPAQGLVINKILDAVYESAQTGSPVKI